MFSYEFEISKDFPNSTVNSDKLQDEVKNNPTIGFNFAHLGTADNSCVIYFHKELSNLHFEILEGIVNIHGLTTMNIRPLEPKTTDGKPIYSIWPTEGTRKTFISHNWCDKTTWTSSAVRVVDEIASPVVVGTTYDVDNDYLIDTYHGKITGEDFLTDASGNSYRVVVKVNDVIKTERDPHVGSGGDYTINYNTGRITFSPVINILSEVKVTYHYATTADFSIKPDPGKILKIKRVEVQFSSDIVITDSVKFQLYIGGQPYGAPMVYKTLMDYINEANGSYPPIPALGIGNVLTDWRNNGKDIITFPWDYQALTELKSSYAAEIRILLDHNTSFGGNCATATFYCLIENE